MIRILMTSGLIFLSLSPLTQAQEYAQQKRELQCVQTEVQKTPDGGTEKWQCHESEVEESPAEETEFRSELLNIASSIYLTLSQNLSPTDGYPRSIDNGQSWETTNASGWTSGFFPGILWQLYKYTEDESFLQEAQKWTQGLEGEKTGSDHDVGFKINNSFGHGYRIAGIEKYKEVTLQAAAHLASRFDERVGATRSWDWGDFKFPVIIDNMMNLELLFWAAKNGGDPELAEIAKTHAMTTIRDLIREDGSTFHVVDYNPETGEVIKQGTFQGLNDNSMWARGQAWAIYGFTVAYRETAEPIFLETAIRVADRFLEELPDDGIPYWDFDVPQIPEEQKDASAAAVAASGLWELAYLVEEESQTIRYREASKNLVKNLASDYYLAFNSDLPAMLLHSTGHKPGNSEIDVPIIYGDYYFIEALIRQISTENSNSLPGNNIDNIFID